MEDKPLYIKTRRVYPGSQSQIVMPNSSWLIRWLIGGLEFSNRLEGCHVADEERYSCSGTRVAEPQRRPIRNCGKPKKTNCFRSVSRPVPILLSRNDPARSPNCPSAARIPTHLPLLDFCRLTVRASRVAARRALPDEDVDTGMSAFTTCPDVNMLLLLTRDQRISK